MKKFKKVYLFSAEIGWLEHSYIKGTNTTLCGYSFDPDLLEDNHEKAKLCFSCVFKENVKSIIIRKNEK